MQRPYNSQAQDEHGAELTLFGSEDIVGMLSTCLSWRTADGSMAD